MGRAGDEGETMAGRAMPSGRRAGHAALRRLAVVVLLAGLALAAAPVGTWFELDMGPFGAVTASGLGEVEAVDGDGRTEPDAGAGSPDWIVGQIPDGVLAIVVGVVLIGLAATWVARSLDRSQAVGVRRAGTVAAALGAAALVVVAWSWVRFDRTIDRQREELGRLDPLAQLAVDQVQVEPGYGLLVAGAAAAVAVLAGLRVVVRGAGPSDTPMAPGPIT